MLWLIRFVRRQPSICFISMPTKFVSSAERYFCYLQGTCRRRRFICFGVTHSCAELVVLAVFISIGDGSGTYMYFQLIYRNSTYSSLLAVFWFFPKSKGSPKSKAVPLHWRHHNTRWRNPWLWMRCYLKFKRVSRLAFTPALLSKLCQEEAQISSIVESWQHRSKMARRQ